MKRRKSYTGSNNSGSKTSSLMNVKLDFQRLNALYGRNDEIEQAMAVYAETAASEKCSTQVLLVHGAAGTGKTALCRMIKKKAEPPCIFVEGKFDPLAVEPFSGIKQAFAKMAEYFENKDSRERAQIEQAYRFEQRDPAPMSHKLSRRPANIVPVRQQKECPPREGNTPTRSISQGLPRREAAMPRRSMSLNDTFARGQMSISKLFKHSARDVTKSPPVRLSSHVANMQRLIQLNEGDGDIQSLLATIEKGGSLDHVKHSFCAYLRAVCSPTKPIVIFLRGLQWADMASLELLQSLAQDSKCSGLLIVGSYRDDEKLGVPIQETLNRLSRGDNVVSVRVDDLKQKDLHRLISDVTFTSSDLSKTEELADIVHKKTNGNCFFAIQFLHMLNREDMLYMNFSTSEYECDTPKVKAETNIADNVVDLVASKLRTLPAETQDTLQLASCLGSHFELEVLAEVMEKNVVSIMTALKIAEEESLIDMADEKVFKWGHDKIQQSAYGLLPEGSERKLVHLKIGLALKEMIETSDKEWILFMAAEQLNRASGLISDESKKIELVMLNISAAESVLEKSAFFPASEYLKAAVKLLGNRENRWKNHYSLALKVCTKLAEITCSLGQFRQGDALILQVLLSAKNADDKMAAYFSQVHSFSAQGNLVEAIDLGIETLKMLHEPVTHKPNKAQVAFELIRIRRLLSKMDELEILSLPEMTNPKKMLAMEMLARVSHWAWSSAQRTVAISLCLRSIRLTLKYGQHDLSPHSFALLAAVVGRSLDYDGAIDYGDLSMNILDNREDMKIAARPMLVIFSSVHHLQSPLQECLDPMLSAYRAGMDSGDVDVAHECVADYVAIYTLVGLPLPAIQADARKFAEQMSTYNRRLTISKLRIYWQYAMNFAGQSNDPLQLTGDAMNQEKMIEELTATSQHTILRTLWTLRMILAYHFGNYKLAGEMCSLIKKEGLDKGDFCVYAQCGYLALTNLALAAEAGINSRKGKIHLKDANGYIKYLSDMVKARNVNAHHILQLCVAERASLDLSNSFDVIKLLYNKAIASSSRSGILHDAAISNERAGKFMLKRGDEERAQDYLVRAAELYLDWGANAKVTQMTTAYAFLPKAPMLSRGHSTTVLARKKFSSDIANKHRSVNISSFNSV